MHQPRGAWLENLDRHEEAARPIMAQVYGQADETRWLANWRLFFLTCSEDRRPGSKREFLLSRHLFYKQRR